MDFSKRAARRALPSRVASLRSVFLLIPTSLGLEMRDRMGQCQFVALIPTAVFHSLLLLLELDLSQLDQILRDLGQPLLSLVRDEIPPILQLLINLLQRFAVITAQSDSFPLLCGRMSALGSLDVQIHFPFVFSYCCVLGIGKGT